MGGHGLQKLPIHPLHLLKIPMVSHAIEQGDDPIGIQFEGGCFLPEPVGAVLVRLDKLGFNQLAGEEKHQLALLQGREAEGLTAGRGAVPSQGSPRLHRSSSRGYWHWPQRGRPWGRPGQQPGDSA